MAGRRGTPRRRRKASRSESVFVDWIEHVRNASQKCSVVVSNKRAADMLRRFNVKHVYYIKEPYFKFIDSIVKVRKECIILIDADRKGNTLAAKVQNDLQNQGIKINHGFRKILFTSACKNLAGFMAFLHKQVAISPRQHEALPKGL